MESLVHDGRSAADRCVQIDAGMQVTNAVVVLALALGTGCGMAPSSGPYNDSYPSRTGPSVSTADFGASPDLGPDLALPRPDLAGPQIIQVGAGECNGHHCLGGNDGHKAPLTMAQSTLDKICSMRGGQAGIDFTLLNITYPGGATFCSWDGSTWRCQTACGNCNPIDTITCR
jgi:hypothetical protein